MYINIIISIIIIIFFINNLMKFKVQNDKNKIIQNSILINAKINQDIYLLLEEFIEEQFDYYMLMNMNFEQEEYINDEKEKIICTNITEIVLKNISQTLLKKVSLIYNEKYIVDIITRKVYLKVMNFVINKNKMGKK